MSDLAALLDRAAIGELLVRYATALDTRDWALLRTCFVDDAVAEYSGRRGTARGIDAIVETCSHALTGLDASQHLLGNVEVDLDGDAARSRSYIHAQHVLEPNTFTVGGTYHDRHVRTEAGWRISHRRLERTWTEGDAGVFAAAEARGRQLR